MAPNLANTPPPNRGEEVWLSNWHKGYQRRLPRAVEGYGEWTRYFNMHSLRHMLATYPTGYQWYKDANYGRPIYLQKVDPDIKSSVAFPKETLQEYFKTSDKPQRYFTCSVCWFIALAIWEHENVKPVSRIELWGFEVRATKPKYAFERPCIAYWILEAEKRGIAVWTPPEMKRPTIDEAGDPNAYDGPLYGYETT